MNPLLDSLSELLGTQRLARLAGVTVGIGGAGGLGSNVALHLVRSGFTRFVLADFDKVQAGNLNRQFYFPDQIGQLKVYALAQNLLRLNPDLKLSLQPVHLTERNMEQIFGSCQVLVEALDDPAAKRMFVENALKLGKRVVSASGLAGWGDSDAIRIAGWQNGRLVIIGDRLTDVKDQPPLAPRVGVVAAKQADVVLSWVLNGVEL